MRDIRSLKDDREAYAQELKQRWTGLLSYRYIGRRHSNMDVDADGNPITDDTVKVRHDFRNSTGGLMIAPLAIASPEGGGRSDLEVVPNPVIHYAELLDPGYDVKVVKVCSTTLKTGRQMSYSRSLIVDADDPQRVIAFTEGQGASLGDAPEGLPRMEENPIEVTDSPDLPPLSEVFGASRRADGHWTLPELSAELASPDAALHIGPQHVVMEAAAYELASALMETGRLQVRSWHVMFLARGKVGPFRVDGEPYRGVDGVAGVRLLMVDEGNAGRPITSCSASFTVVA